QHAARDQVHRPLLRLQRLLGPLPPLHLARRPRLRGGDADQPADGVRGDEDHRGAELRETADARREQPEDLPRRLPRPRHDLPRGPPPPQPQPRAPPRGLVRGRRAAARRRRRLSRTPSFRRARPLASAAMSDRADEDPQRLEPLTALGEAIRTLRTQAGLSQEELARQAELEAPTLTAFEAGREEPTWGDLRRIAYVLQVPLERLLEV